jgi:hypothetical protein
MQDVDQPVGNLTKAILANLVQGHIIHVSVQGYILRRVSCEWLIGQIASHRTAAQSGAGGGILHWTISTRLTSPSRDPFQVVNQ